MIRSAASVGVCGWVALVLVGLAAHPLSVTAATISTTGLVDWFDPDVGVTTDGNGNVSAWTNQADANRSVTTASSATSVVAGPGGSLIRFDAAADAGFLPYASPGTAALADGYTVFSDAACQHPGRRLERLSPPVDGR